MNKLDIISEIIKNTDCEKCNHYIKGTNDCFRTVKEFKECLFLKKINKKHQKVYERVKELLQEEKLKLADMQYNILLEEIQRFRNDSNT